MQIPPAFLHGVKEMEYQREKSPRGGTLRLRRPATPERIDMDRRREERSRGSRDREERHRNSRHARSRSPRDRRDYRDSKRRGDDTGRYCIELTNLPFRVTEIEIREYVCRIFIKFHDFLMNASR
ncbi:unnamed protein product [Gongylonema pulchrum]|uniref:RRM domain-containing protein n=1 Tax=Gongylonema pulchrum TaxID=637853 RepID=A0A3P6RHG7_9BILA|nr:unnamed protein product [Gongylonema pulchrum]